MRLLLSRALPLVLAAASVDSARNIFLTEQEASDRHLSVQERTCADEYSAVAVTGSGAFLMLGGKGHGLDFTAHVCAAEDGSGHRATGKVFSTAHAENGGHALYHAHCAYIDKERGFAYLGLEIEDMKSPEAAHVYGEDGERLSIEGSAGEERKLAKSAKSAKATKSPSKSKSSKSAPEVCRFRERGLEVISGNEPKGTLSIFRFEKGTSADRFAMSHHVAFDTTCEGFEDVVKTVQFTDEEVSDLTKGKFHIP